MPICLENGIYVTVNELPEGPMPRPLKSGFSESTAYRVLGIESFSESAEAFFILSNDRDEVWFVSNRHFRVLGKFDYTQALRFPVTDQPASSSRDIRASMRTLQAGAAHF